MNYYQSATEPFKISKQAMFSYAVSLIMNQKNEHIELNKNLIQNVLSEIKNSQNNMNEQSKLLQLLTLRKNIQHCVYAKTQNF